MGLLINTSESTQLTTCRDVLSILDVKLYSSLPFPAVLETDRKPPSLFSNQKKKERYIILHYQIVTLFFSPLHSQVAQVSQK